MNTAATFRQDNVKVNGDMRATLREVARRWPHGQDGRRAQSILAKKQKHIRRTEANRYMALLGAM